MAGGTKKRQRGTIRERGNSYQVIVYAGFDPVTGKRLYLRESTPDPREAESIRIRLCARVDDQRHAKSKATFRVAYEKWLRVAELAETTREDYERYARLHFYPVLGDEPAAKISAAVLEEFYAELRRCSKRCRSGQPVLDHRTAGRHECRVVRHRRRPGRPSPTGMHDCAAAGCTVTECPPHRCKPLAPATIRRMHFAIQGALTAAKRWGWITENPATIAAKPRQPSSEPDPPTAEQAARIIEAAWAEDANWGTLVWLVMVTGIRRAELLALRWRRVELVAGTIEVRRNWVNGSEKATQDSPDAPDRSRPCHRVRITPRASLLLRRVRPRPSRDASGGVNPSRRLRYPSSTGTTRQTRDNGAETSLVGSL